MVQNLLKLRCRFVSFAQSQVNLTAQVVGPKQCRSFIRHSSLQKFNCLIWLIASQFDGCANHRHGHAIRKRGFGITLRQFVSQLLRRAYVAAKRAV